MLSGEEGSRALFLIGLGLAKKFFIADYLGNNLVNRVFDLPTLYSGGDVLVAVYAYAFQLYYDFSGYSDIAVGAGLLLGIRLPVNFNAPYRALNITDFWRRWHISFSNWLRDYLYFSLPGPRTKVMPYVNLIITMARRRSLARTELDLPDLGPDPRHRPRRLPPLADPDKRPRADRQPLPPHRRIGTDVPLRPVVVDFLPRRECRHRAQNPQPDRPLPLRFR